MIVDHMYVDKAIINNYGVTIFVLYTKHMFLKYTNFIFSFKDCIIIIYLTFYSIISLFNHWYLMIVLMR